MTRKLTLAALPLLAASCVHETRVTARPVSPAAPAAVPTVWDRQIRNAVDAGDGDYRLRVLRETVAADAENIPARIELARAYRDRGFPDVALEVCRLAAARFPDSGAVQLALVRALREMNRRQEAIDGLEVFLRGHPQAGSDYLSWLGILRDETGAWYAGEPAHRRAVELAPASDVLHNNLGYNLLMQKKNEEAAAEFREALRLNPGSQMAKNNLGLVLANQDAAEQAVANWQSVSDPATAHNNLAAVLMEQGNYAGARQELQMALSYNKSNSAALRNLELVARLEGKPATMDAQPGESRRPRRSGFKRLFVGPLEDSRTEPANTASAPITGEKQ
jgi:Flp pilus assembly protein TadD